MGEERTMTAETDPIRVDFLPRDETVLPGLLGMSFGPGMKELGRCGCWDLESDMRVLGEGYGTDTLVSLMEEHEYRGYGMPELFERDPIGGIEMLRFAIEDINVLPKEAEAPGDEGGSSRSLRLARLSG